MTAPTKKLKLGLLAAAPVPYQVPLYRRVANDPRLDFTAIFWTKDGIVPFDGGYGQPITLGDDLCSGYQAEFLPKADSSNSSGGVFALRDMALLRLLRRKRFDVLWIHGYSFAGHLAALIEQRRLGGQVLLREEQTLLHRRPLLKEMVRASWIRFMVERSSSLYIGLENLRWFEKYGANRESCFFVPYCVDNDEIAATVDRHRRDACSLRREFDINVGEPVIVTVARLIPKKNIPRLVEAVASVSSHHSCTLVVAGSGPEQAVIREKIASAGVGDRVRMLGFVKPDRISRVYAAADIFCLPSNRHETWGVAVNEAMSAGLPIVVSDVVGSATDLVRAGRNGYVVPANDVEGLARVLTRLVVDPDLRRRLGEESRRIVRTADYSVAAEGVAQAVLHASSRPLARVSAVRATERSMPDAVGRRTR